MRIHIPLFLLFLIFSTPSVISLKKTFGQFSPSFGQFSPTFVLKRLQKIKCTRTFDASINVLDSNEN